MGCPRSGTTMTGEIINSHKHACMLVERHSKLMRQRQLSTDSYINDIVNDFSKYPTEHQEKNLTILKSLSNETVCYGDKIPKLYEFPGIIKRLLSDNCTIMVTLRNPMDIGLSYQARNQSAEDSWSHDITDCIRDYNIFVKQILEYSKIAGLLVLDYDIYSLSFSSFDAFKHNAHVLYELMGLMNNNGEVDELSLEKTYTIARQSLPGNNNERNARRLLPTELRDLCMKVNFSNYQDVISKNPKSLPVFKLEN